jgi:hypothetical protein
MIQLPPSHIEITWQVAGVLTLIIATVTGGLARYVRSSINSAVTVLEGKLKVSAVEGRASLIFVLLP